MAVTKSKAVSVKPVSFDGAKKSSSAGNANLASLRGENVSAWFGERKVLDRVNLEMKPGKVTALIGPSGCGKSTFLRILNRMHEMVPSASLAGKVILDGVDIYDPTRRVTDARREIGMVFQKPNPFPAMSIYENVISGLKLTSIKKPKSELDDLVEEALTKASLFKEVKDRLDAPGGGLSGGQQQRLCIARTIAVSPEVILMDEPCSALDPIATMRIEDLMMELKKDYTIIIVTHNMQQAARVADKTAFFTALPDETTGNRTGVLVEYDTTTKIFENPADPRTDDYISGRFG